MLKKYFKKRMCTYVSMLLAITTFVQSLYITPITAHAEIKVPELATSSNALQASPMTLEVPDAAPLAMSGMTAAQWVWRALFSLFGVAVNDDDSLEALSTDVTSYINKTYDKNANIFKTLAKLTTIGWGEILQGCPELKKAIGEYFASKEGFGTETGLDHIIISQNIKNDISDSWAVKYFMNTIFISDLGLNPSDYVFSGYNKALGANYHVWYDYYLPGDIDINKYKIVAVSRPNSNNTRYGTLYKYEISTGIISEFNINYLFIPVVTYDSDRLYPGEEVIVGSNSDIIFNSSTGSLNDETLAKFPYLYFKNYESMEHYFKTGEIVNTYNTVFDDGQLVQQLELQINSKPQIQGNTESLSVGEDLTLPSDEQAGTEALENISSAIDIDALAKALANYMTVTYNPSSSVYENMVYIVKTLATYCGVENLDMDIINKFIIQLAGSTVPDTVEERESEAKLCVIIPFSQYVNTSSNNNPDDNNFKISKVFAVSLLSFLVSLGLTSDSPNFDNEPIIENLHVVNTLPDSGNNDKPNENPDNGILKFLSDILSYLEEIIKALLNLNLLVLHPASI